MTTSFPVEKTRSSLQGGVGKASYTESNPESNGTLFLVVRRKAASHSEKFFKEVLAAARSSQRDVFRRGTGRGGDLSSYTESNPESNGTLFLVVRRKAASHSEKFFKEVLADSTQRGPHSEMFSGEVPSDIGGDLSRGTVRRKRGPHSEMFSGEVPAEGETFPGGSSEENEVLTARCFQERYRQRGRSFLGDRQKKTRSSQRDVFRRGMGFSWRTDVQEGEVPRMELFMKH